VPTARVETTLFGDAKKGDDFLVVTDITGINAGDIVLLLNADGTRAENPWDGSSAGLVVTSVGGAMAGSNGGEVFLAQNLKKDSGHLKGNAVYFIPASENEGCQYTYDCLTYLTTARIAQFPTSAEQRANFCTKWPGECDQCAYCKATPPTLCTSGEFVDAPAASPTAEPITASCKACEDGTYVAAKQHSNAACTNHKVCGSDEFEDELLTVDAVTDRVCTAHRTCDSTTTYQSAAGTATSDTVCLVLDECDATTEYESVAPTANTNRGCADISAACQVGTFYESASSTPTTDRVCAAVDICIKSTNSVDTLQYPGFYMASKPTATDNTGCKPLKSCNYESQEIVDPASVDAAVLALEVYNVDRTCVDRDTCVDTYETTAKDAYTTTCVTVETQTYEIEFPDTTCSDLFTNTMASNADWETYLTDDRKGEEGYTAGEWTNVGSSMAVKVKGTADVYAGEMKSVASNGDAGCKAFVPIFFVATTRARKSTLDAGANRAQRKTTVYPESNTPVVYAVGSKQCSADPAAKCCEKGYGADDSSTCVECVELTYTENETAANANAGCSAQPACNFASEFYRNAAPPTTKKAGNNCQAMQSCSQQGRLSKPLVEGENRECSNDDIVLCDSSINYWANSDDAQFADTYEWAVNPTCNTMKVCEKESWWTNDDATVDVPACNSCDGRRRSAANLAVQQVYTEDRICATRTCNADQYATNYATVAAEGTNSNVDYDCQTWDTCALTEAIATATPIRKSRSAAIGVAGGADSTVPRTRRSTSVAGYTSVQGTLSADAVCNPLDVCDPATQWESVAPTSTTNRYCTDLSPACDVGQGTNPAQWEEASNTPTSDRKCTDLIECTIGEQWQDLEPTPTSNRGCTDLYSCKDNEDEVVAPTPTSDRKCDATYFVDCPGGPIDNFEVSPQAGNLKRGANLSSTEDAVEGCASACNLAGANCNFFAFNSKANDCVLYTPIQSQVYFKGSPSLQVFKVPSKKALQSKNSNYLFYTRAASCPSFAWKEVRGCCREDRKQSHGNTATSWYLTKSSFKDAMAICTDTCANNDDCTAFELITKRSKRLKSTKYKCEQHVDTINSGSRKSKSCKKAVCHFKVQATTPNTSAPDTSAPTSAPTSTPTATPIAAKWNDLRGCCRELNVKKRLVNHVGKVVPISDKSYNSATETCKQECDNDGSTCTAVETRRIKKRKVVRYVCELHSADGINKSSRASKSCKKAVCSIKN